MMTSSLRDDDDDDDDNIKEPTESTRPGGSWNLRYVGQLLSFAASL